MEPLTALAVATATVQFVEFGTKILRLCKEIRTNAKGATEANAELESTTHQLQEIQKLFKPIDAAQGVPQTDVDVINKAQRECDDAASELLQILEGLKPRRRRWFVDDAKAAFRAHRTQNKVESLQKKLEGRRERFQNALTADTRNRVLHMLDEQKKAATLIQDKVLPEVQRIRAEGAAGHSTTQNEISLARADIASAHQDLDAKLTTTAFRQENTGKQIEGRLEEARITAVQKNFLDSLSFPGMSARHESIDPPAAGTYEWIFNDGRHLPDENLDERKRRKRDLQGKFKHWLSSDERVFWISGKAGSGKSSLMSFIENDKRLETGLKQWSSDRPLTILNFFFWRPGSDLQKSIPGLLRSLIHQLLKQKPSAIDNICAQNPDLVHSNWTTARLMETLTNVLMLYHRADDFVFFLIDGLDELEGDHLELVDVIVRAVHIGNAKICLSSRPEPALRSRLDLHPSLRLEDLNYDDIEKFVRSKLPTINDGKNYFIERIARRAEGIFLWAALVSRDIVEGILALDDGATLEKRLHDFPSGLEPLFTRLFSSISKPHRQFLLFVFQILKIHQDADVAFVTACLHRKHIATLPQFLELCHEVRQQITIRSKGLLEVRTNNGDTALYVMGWALQDPCKEESCQDALEDGVFQSWMSLGWLKVSWLHRSAYDHIFSNSETNLPSWIHEIDIAQDVILGSAWLFKYGLLMCIWNVADDVYLESEIDYLLKPLTDVIELPANESVDFGCRILDSLAEVLHFSLSEGSWLDKDLRHHLKATDAIRLTQIYNISREFWSRLVTACLHEYMLSRFGVLRNGRFARPICGYLLGFGIENLGAPLMRLILDYLIAEATNPRDSSAKAQKAHQYRFYMASYIPAENLSWSSISIGSLVESHTATGIHMNTREDRAQLLQKYERSPDHASPADLTARLKTLAEQWQLYRGPGLRERESQLLLVQIPVACSEIFDRDDEVMKIRLIGKMRAKRPLLRKNHAAGDLPICVFHPSHATNLMLNGAISEELEVGWGRTLFKGSFVTFSKCRDVLVKEIWANIDGQLDAWGQLYLLACIKTQFRKHWIVEENYPISNVEANGKEAVSYPLGEDET